MLIAPAQTLTLTPIAARVPARTQNTDSDCSSFSGLKCKLWQESTPALLLRDHLWQELTAPNIRHLQCFQNRTK